MSLMSSDHCHAAYANRSHTRRRRVRSVSALGLVGALVVTSCGGNDDADVVNNIAVQPGAEESMAAVRVVNADEFSAAISTGQPTIIDVRTPSEFSEGHIDGAVLIDLSSATFIEDVQALPRDGAYAVYCRSGNRSATATAAMRELGFTNIVELGGGILEWSASGYPVVIP